MIIKSKAIKSPKMDKIMNYVMTDKGRISIGQADPIYYNLLSSDLEQISSEFSSISDKRKRKSSTYGYHIIMSWDKEDSESGVLTRDVVDELAHKFIDLRGAEGICLAVQHRNNDNTHVHFLFSSHDISSIKSLRIDNKEFRRIRAEMEQYQLERYPSLRSDIHEHYRDSHQNRTYEKASRRVSDGEYHLKKSPKISDKEHLKEILSGFLKKSNSAESWWKAIESHPDLELYQYKSKVNGVLYKGKKYRFNRLGVNHQETIKLQELNRLARRSKSKKQER